MKQLHCLGDGSSSKIMIEIETTLKSSKPKLDEDESVAAAEATTCDTTNNNTEASSQEDQEMKEEESNGNGGDGDGGGGDDGDVGEEMVDDVRSTVENLKQQQQQQQPDIKPLVNSHLNGTIKGEKDSTNTLANPITKPSDTKMSKLELRLMLKQLHADLRQEESKLLLLKRLHYAQKIPPSTQGQTTAVQHRIGQQANGQMMNKQTGQPGMPNTQKVLLFIQIKELVFYRFFSDYKKIRT